MQPAVWRCGARRRLRGAGLVSQLVKHELRMRVSGASGSTQTAPAGRRLRHRPQVAGVQKKVDEVTNIMSDNIEQVLARGEKLDLLVDKTDNLMFEVSTPPGPQDTHARAGLE